MVFSGWESVFFWIFSIAAILAGLLTVMARNAVHSALFLISSLVSVAALFILLGAEFIAGVQILVYVGGVMVLFLFVIMLVNVGAEEEGRAAIFNRPAQVTAALVFLGDASYSIYLVHWLAILALTGFVAYLRLDIAAASWAPWAYVAAQAAFALAASVAVYLAFEKPVTRALQRRMRERSDRTSPASQSAALSGSLDRRR